MGKKARSLSASRLLRQFESSGGAGKFCRPFKELSPPAQQYPLSAVELVPDEIPVIGCFFNEEHWSLLTTERLIWNEKGRKNILSSSDISSVSVKPGELFEAQAKDQLTSLSIITKDGRSLELNLESGPPFFGFWNVLKIMAG